MMISPSLPCLCHLDRHVFLLPLSFAVLPLYVVPQPMLLFSLEGIIELSVLPVPFIVLCLDSELVLEHVEVLGLVSV